MVEQVTAKLPNAMTKSELMDGGLSDAEATQVMNKRVFGDDHKVDAKTGAPVEQGIGSVSNPMKSTHLAALAKENERKAIANPNSAEVIAAAVAAGVKAGMSASKEAEQF